MARGAERFGDPEALSHNLNGQKLGRKGRVTRERILAATAELLAGPRETPISLSAVARQASLGMTSLYNYFTDFTELLLAVLEPVMESAEQAYLEQLRRRWPDGELAAHCSAFVFAYHAFWSRNARLLHLRNAMSEERDHRMMMHRVNSTQPIIHLLVEQMGGDPTAPRSPEYALATMLMIGIERSVTVATNEELPWLLVQDIQHDATHFLHPGARLLELAIRDVRERNGTADAS